MPGPAAPSHGRDPELADELGRLAAWARFCREELTVEGVRACVEHERHVPAEVRTAWAAVRDAVAAGALDPGTPVRPVLPDAKDVIDAWIGTLDERDLVVVRDRLVREGRTLDQIGKDHGVSRERVRQVESRLRDALEEHLSTPEWTTVRWAVDQLRAVVGAWAPLNRLSGLDTEEEATLLVAHLADLRVDTRAGVLARPGFSLPKVQELPFLAPEGVLLEERGARALLRRAGVRRELYDDALEAIGLRRVDRVWVRWGASLVDRAIAILAVRQEPMTADELCTILESDSLRSLRNRVQTHPLAQRVTRTTVGLRSWGRPEYTSVAQLMLDTLEEAGGSLPVRTVAERLHEVFDVRPGTVNAFSSAPVFVLEDGVLRRRGADEPYEVDADPRGTRGLSVADDGTVIFDVPVDHEVVRGSARPVPEPVGGALGLTPGDQLELVVRTEQGEVLEPVVVGWSPTSHVGPYLGSVRAAAQAVGADEGDTLRLVFAPEGGAVTVARVGPDAG